ncbi:hypothetical protein PMZ80_009342 [Knufia obscura]|uniref:Uncharacterized protein n=1 Tax=Knufia obscura TaxID=1635080 RepID=A0ABR0RCK5_9EURO|nr:hypothetical protein PMZ80_009342 [Knufia obscura]
MADQNDTVKVSATDDGICIISINRPNRRNAVDPTTAHKLYDAFLAFEADDAQKICVLYGENGTFCAGADLHEVSRLKPEQMGTPRTFEERSLGPMGPSRLQVRKPVIAAVAGHAVAGGLELSLLGDLRVVEESAIFGVFCRRWGVPLIDGGTVRLQRVVGLGRAMDMILTGRPVDARKALQMGLANHVVPDGQALQEALVIARQLVQFPQLCMRADRDSTYHAAYEATSFHDAMKFEYERGWPIVAAESTAGAARFSAGQGRHGSFKEFNSKSKL